MTRTLVANVDLYDRHAQKFVPAELFDQIDKKNLDDFEQKWRPLLMKRARKTIGLDEKRAARVEDANWDWAKQLARLEGEISYRSFAVEAEGITQGMMLLDTLHRSRFAERRGADLVYISMLASAPWNRTGFTDRPRFKGAGLILMQAAVSYSLEEELLGAVGLHSLEQSLTWYRDVLRMTDFGPDSAFGVNDLHYLELSPEQASTLVNSSRLGS